MKMTSEQDMEQDPLLREWSEGRPCRRGNLALGLIFGAAVGLLMGVVVGRHAQSATLLSGAWEVTAPLPPTLSPPARPENTKSLLGAWDVIKTKEFVDLTHAFSPGIPSWPGFPTEKRRTLYSIDASGGGELGTGFWAEEFCHVGQWGTHVDPPAHFVKGMRTVDEIRPKEMMMPLVVIDVHDKVAADPDYVLSMDDVKEWEGRHGKVPEGSFVIMRTDWSKRWPDADSMTNKDSNGIPHYPGWTQETLTYLYEECKIMASGHETTDTDPGFATAKDDYTLETYILGTDHYQIELLNNVDKLPEWGALIVASFPKPRHGSGFPARVFAILP
mmetsp:Transcript_48145/g.115490  ORF Transcript_48145/g.115490 Transcript_48145/m.115490 type:complete len:331 (-) Transcript_48145:280-1272(-)